MVGTRDKYFWDCNESRHMHNIKTFSTSFFVGWNIQNILGFCIKDTNLQIILRQKRDDSSATFRL